MEDDLQLRRTTTSGWRDEGPTAIARGLEPDAGQETQDESLWLALNAWG